MKKIPITLITGFLGSGKTTLINKILAKRPELKISIVLNEFGDTQLESQLIKKKDGNIIELSNGCMCCVAELDFERIINWIFTNKPETEYILIEASGLSDPLPIATVLSELPLCDQVQLDTIVCVIDGQCFFQTKEKYATSMVQLANSDIALVAKVANEEQSEFLEIQKFIEHFLPRVKVLTINEDLPLDLILNTEKTHTYNSSTTELHGQSLHQHEHLQEYIWKSQTPFDFNKLNTLLKRLPVDIIRVKGSLLVKENGQEKKIVLQYVGTRSEVSYESWEANQPKQSTILFLGKEFDKQKLETDLQACLNT